MFLFFLKKRLAFYGGDRAKIIKKNIKNFLENKVKIKNLNLNTEGHNIILKNIKKNK